MTTRAAGFVITIIVIIIVIIVVIVVISIVVTFFAFLLLFLFAMTLFRKSQPKESTRPKPTCGRSAS